MKLDWWKSPASDPHVKPNPAVELPELVRMAGGPTARVLDYGCGFGRLAVEFRDYVGADVAHHRIDAVKQRRPECLLLLLDGSRIDWPERDVVLFVDVLLHLDDSTVRSAFGQVAGCAPRIVICEHLDWPDRDGDFAYRRSLADYEGMLYRHGFKLEELVEVDNPRYGKPLQIVSFQA